MHVLDGTIIATGLTSFVLFFVVQCMAFRFLKTEQILGGIMTTALSMGLCNIALSIGVAWLCPDFFAATGMLGVLLTVFVSFIIYGLLIFVYILCIFGPYETSIRMRLIRELHQGPEDGQTLEELLERYSAKQIAIIRLQRLVGAKDLGLENNKYHIQQHRNMFFIIDLIANQIQKWINPRP